MVTKTSLADNDDCVKYDKLSKEYAKCNALLLKKKSLEIKVKASKEVENVKKKFNKSDLKKKLLKFKNSKSYKEYKEN
mgnify:CR=1 FL=1